MLNRWSWRKAINWRRRVTSKAAQLPRRMAITGLGIEPLEDRALLSINSLGFLASAHHHGDTTVDSPRIVTDMSLATYPTADQGWRFARQGVFGGTSNSQAAIATHYFLSFPSGTTAGQTATAKLLAFDANNHFVQNYSGTADLTSSDAAITLPASVTFQNGQATFQVTLATVGQQTITATDEADASIGATATTNVASPSLATHYLLTIPSGATVGSPVTVQVTAIDAENFPVKGDNSTVDLTSSDGAATLPASVTLNKGRATFQTTFGTAGLQFISAVNESDASVIGSASTNVVDAAAATHFVLFLRQGVNAGAAVTVQILALDASNHLVTNFSDTVNLTSSDAAATLPASVTFQDGRAQFQVTFATPGQQSLAAIDSADSTIVGSAFTSVAISYFTIALPHSVTAGAPVTVQLVAKDVGGSPLATYSGTANVSSSDAAATLPSSVTFVNGRASVQVTFSTTGQQTLTVTDSVTPVGTATTNVVTAAIVTHFVAYTGPGTTVGEATRVRIVAEDAQNHIVTNYSGTANITSSDAAATLPASVVFTNGQASFFQVTFGTEGQQTVTVTNSVDSSITGTATTSVAAQAIATHFVIVLRPGTAVGVPTRVVVVAEDAHNHVVSNYSGTVDLSSSDPSVTLPASLTFNHGRATFELTFSTLGSQTITASDSSDSSITGTATINVGNEPGWAGGFFGRFHRGSMSNAVDAFFGSSHFS